MPRPSTCSDISHAEVLDSSTVVKKRAKVRIGLGLEYLIQKEDESV
jgi:hypothetical protein